MTGQGQDYWNSWNLEISINISSMLLVQLNKWIQILECLYKASGMLTDTYVFLKNIYVKVIQSDYSVNEGSFCCKLKEKNHQSA